MLEMREQGGFLWPATDEVGATAILTHAARHFPAMLAHVPVKGLAVQAGGNVGVYPKKLAEAFILVHTFEPAADNLACLDKNLAGISNIRVHAAALGAAERIAHLRRHATNAGAHRLAGDGENEVRVTTIDALLLPKCDLIWLDIEGREGDALAGAERTIDAFRPVVILEDMGLADEGEGLARHWLSRRGYRQAAKIMHDYVMVPG